MSNGLPSAATHPQGDTSNKLGAMTNPWGTPPADDPHFPSYPPPPPPAGVYPTNQYPQYPPYPQYPGVPPWGAAPPAHPQAQLAMILGIVGLVCFSFVSPFAIWLGHKSMREIDASGGQLSGRGQAQAGFIMGIIGTALLCLGLIVLVILAATSGSQT